MLPKSIPWVTRLVLAGPLLLPACQEPTDFDDGCLVDFVPNSPVSTRYALTGGDSVTVESGYDPVSCLPMGVQSPEWSGSAAEP